jgi:hypothetical protein
VKLHELRIVLDDGAGNLVAQALRERATQVIARFLMYSLRERSSDMGKLNSSACKR